MWRQVWHKKQINSVTVGLEKTQPRHWHIWQKMWSANQMVLLMNSKNCCLHPVALLSWNISCVRMQLCRLFPLWKRWTGKYLKLRLWVHLTEATPSSGDAGYCSFSNCRCIDPWYLLGCTQLIRISQLQFANNRAVDFVPANFSLSARIYFRRVAQAWQGGQGAWVRCKEATPFFAALSASHTLTVWHNVSAAASQLQMCRHSYTWEDLAHLNCSLTIFNRVLKYQVRTGTQWLISTGKFDCQNQMFGATKGRKRARCLFIMSQFQ